MSCKGSVGPVLAATIALGGAACGSSDGTATRGSVDASLGETTVPVRSIESTFGLVAEADGYALEVVEVSGVGGQAISASLTRDGKSVDPGVIGPVHVFVIGDELSYFQHDVRPDLSHWMNVGRPGGSRVVVAFDDGAGELVLGQHVDVVEESDFSGSGPRSTLTDVVHRSGGMVERTGWTFSATGSLLRRDLDTTTSALTLVREADGAVSHQELSQTGEGVYRFAPTVPGAGDYLAVLELAAAPAFGFRVSLDGQGRFVERAEASLVRSIQEFAIAMDEQNATAVRDAFSSRCRSILPEDYAAELLQLLGPDGRSRLTSVEAEIVGDTATVSYEVIVGEYSPEVTPDWTIKREQWLDEDGRWRRDSCQAGYLDW